ncbi:hypothetical protein CDAR_487601 [Caerostris darwini]|uniref:Uncharacterized protein n=1 Tax=Caerostris darwini TaxID=1538125 RepID=A0AAV4PUU5_9ARAC|nr:hypothetical protein CDAR_487601 [Caerostris darwini]
MTRWLFPENSPKGKFQLIRCVCVQHANLEERGKKPAKVSHIISRLIVIRPNVSSVNYFISPNHFRTLIGLGCIGGCIPTITPDRGCMEADEEIFPRTSCLQGWWCGRTVPFPEAALVNWESLPSSHADCNPSYIFIHIDEYHPKRDNFRIIRINLELTLLSGLVRNALLPPTMRRSQNKGISFLWILRLQDEFSKALV